jgi:nucleoid DNA-binding protein
MKNITKADIVDSVSKSTGITKIDTKAVVEGALASIIEAITKGHKVEIRGFGVFSSKLRKPRIARNPKTGESVPLKERYVPLFKASGDFTQKVNESRSSDSKNESFSPSAAFSSDNN